MFCLVTLGMLEAPEVGANIQFDRLDEVRSRRSVRGLAMNDTRLVSWLYTSCFVIVLEWFNLDS